MKSLDRCVEDIASQMEAYPHLYRYDDSVFRRIREGTGTLSEYENLDVVFRRERQSGFQLPEHEVVRDDDAVWLRTEYVEGLEGQRALCHRHEERFLDAFLSSYSSVLSNIIDEPEEVFPSDTCLKQFIYSDEDWYLVDLEPRQTSLTVEPSKTNESFLNNVYRVISELNRFASYDKCLPQTESVMREVVGQVEDEANRFDCVRRCPSYTRIMSWKTNYF